MSAQLSLRIGMSLRDTGIERAYENAGEDWRAAALLAFQEFCRRHHGQEFRIEDFRVWYLSRGGLHPHTHHCWAGLAKTAEAKGWIAATGKFVLALSPATRAHRVQVYRAA